jgi:hypothetical protein
MYWKIKMFKSYSDMEIWIEKNGRKNQWHEVFVNNAYAVEYKPLMIIDIN